MRRSLRLRVGSGMLVLSIAALAICGSFYLGRLYLNIVKEGDVPKSRIISNGSEPVAAPDDSKLLLLNPVPVYFLQVGVFSDFTGAQDAAKPLAQLGYKPYITQSAPYKIWVGVYKNRGDTETVKKILRDKGFGSFTGSIVVNGSNLRYGKGNEDFMNQITPTLELYTLWLKENLELFRADTVEGLNSELLKKQQTVVDDVYTKIYNAARFQTNNETINKCIKDIEDTTGGYNQHLEAFKLQKSAEGYSILQQQLLRFIDNYLHLLREIDNLSKT